MTWKEKLEKAKQLFEEAKTILANPEATAEDKERIEPLIEEAKKLKIEAGQLKDIAEFGAELVEDIEAKEAEEPTKVMTRLSPMEQKYEEAKFMDWGEFLYVASQAMDSTNKAPADPRLFVLKETAGGEEVKQMAEGVGASGGFLVPTQFLAEIQGIVGENAIVRPRAKIVPMKHRTLQIPVLNQTATGVAGIPCWFGNARFYWGAENAPKSHNEPTFRQIELCAHKLYGLVVSSNELLDDSAISLSALLGGELGLPGGIVWSEDFTFLQGMGVGQPQGVIPAPATITVNRAAAGTIGYPDVVNMLGSFLPSGKGVWVISQNALPTIVQLAGPAGFPSYVWSTNAADGIPGFMFGYPVIWSEKVPAMGTAGDVGLYDFGYYVLGDRQRTTLESTREGEDYWTRDQTGWRAVHRVDGQPWLSAPLTYQDQVTQVSPFVILGDPE